MAERKWGRIVLGLLFAALALNALNEVVQGATGVTRDPQTLTVLQMLAGITAAVASVGAWRLPAWAPAAAMAYGVVGGVMVALLPMLLALEPEASSGIWVGAVLVLALGLASGWYLKRVRRSLTAASSAAN